MLRRSIKAALLFNCFPARRVPFATSFLVLAYACWVLWLHYRSYALLRLVHLRYGLQTSAGACTVPCAQRRLEGVYGLHALRMP